jgi:hypothetical protein
MLCLNCDGVNLMIKCDAIPHRAAWLYGLYLTRAHQEFKGKIYALNISTVVPGDLRPHRFTSQDYVYSQFILLNSPSLK